MTPAKPLTDHKINECNDRIEVMPICAEGQAECTTYTIKINVPQDGDTDDRPGVSKTVILDFQDGPIKEVGVNGLTHEVLLAVLADRLRRYQSGPYACEENATALNHICAAQGALLLRTQKRLQRGVEGTHQV